jgi:ubiquinone/menaquinone biosynthesis C-methylase UbiE
MPPAKSSEIAFRHRRFLRQAEWTRELRLHLYRLAGLARRKRVLELGCGTGAIAAEIAARSNSEVWGLDHSPESLKFAAGEHRASVRWTLGEAYVLPFAKSSFDLIVTHYFWMWVAEPDKVVRECLRVMEPGGYLLSLAEPEYSGGRDTPSQLTSIREQLTEQLASEGADPGMGPKVGGLFRRAGLRTEAGSITQGWGPREHRREFRHEWAFIEKAVGGVKDIKVLKEVEKKAIALGTRRSAMPVHWALGRKP